MANDDNTSDLLESLYQNGGNDMVKINGTFEDVAGMTILAYLENANYDLKRVVVEKNEEIVPKAEYENVVLCDDDTIEVISFVGGG